MLQFTDPVHSIFRYFCTKLLGRLKENIFAAISHSATDKALLWSNGLAVKVLDS